MVPILYFVVAAAGHWLVTTGSRTMAHVATQPQAIASAVVMADLAGSPSQPTAVVLCTGEKHDLVWTYGVGPVRRPLVRSAA